MRKLYFLAAFMMMAATSFAQRNCDLRVIHTIIPDTFKIATPTVPTIIRWGFINLGPNDAVLATDTLYLDRQNLNTGGLLKLILPAAGIPVGDTVYFSDTLNLTSGPASGSIQWCDSLWATQMGGSILADAVIANNKICKSVYVKNTTTGIADLFNGARSLNVHNLNVYPNPATNMIRFDYDFRNSEVTVSVRDLVGRTVYQERINERNGMKQISVDVSTLTAGLYVVEVTTEDSKHVGRVLIQK
jgi:hypothetical protein